MAPDTAAASGLDEAGEVMAAIDGTPERLVIADVSRDDAWLEMPLGETVELADNT